MLVVFAFLVHAALAYRELALACGAIWRMFLFRLRLALLMIAFADQMFL
jgi:hypothetical protein